MTATSTSRDKYAAKYYGVSEKSIEEKACRYAVSLGCWHTKFKSSTNRGLPDRQFKHIHCREFYVEFKRPGGKPRPQQVSTIDKMRTHGFLVFVADNLDEAKRIISSMVAFGEY